MDAMVKATQLWLNEKYGNKTGYVPIDMSDEAGIAGNTGWTTIYALMRAFQIELGITNTANNFGPTTEKLFKQKYPNGIQQPENKETTSGKYGGVYGIIQGALWCKGYAANYGSITEHFNDSTANGVIKMKQDAGLDDADSTVTLNVMKALLSMNQYKRVSGGNEVIRAFQRTLNSKYEDYIGLAPCDGIYTRDTNKAMIKVLQAIEGYSVSAATGNFGDGTKNNLTKLSIPDVNNPEATFLFKAALYLNGYGVTINETWDEYSTYILKEFQKDMLLAQTGKADTDTWMALMISRGNPDRASNGCDTRFEITDARLAILKNEGYEVVGRYLTGGNFKELRVGEAERIISGGMNLFPIFQESGTDLSYFTRERAKKDALKASVAANKYGIPKNSIIYFAVDTDPLDSEIKKYIIPYFETLTQHLNPHYQVGIYGTRNACTQVCNKGYAVTSFVSDMSYGFSGNMGFKIPQNWNLDQYYEISKSESGWDFDLDKTTYSGRFPVVSNLTAHFSYIQPDIPEIPQNTTNILDLIEIIQQLEVLYLQYKNPANLTQVDLARGITNFLRAPKYNDDDYISENSLLPSWYITLGNVVDNSFIEYVKNNNNALYNTIYEYIKGDQNLLTDGVGGLIDLGHLAATTERYLGEITSGPVPAFWAGWGGDLATGMAKAQERYDNAEIGSRSMKEIADSTIGDESTSCSYSDFCSDVDATKLAYYIKNEAEKMCCFSEALSWYYNTYSVNRFSYFADLISEKHNITDLKSSIYDKMTSLAEGLPYLGLLEQKAVGASDEMIELCCNSLGDYIATMINQ